MKSLRRTIFGVNLLFYFSLAITTYINSSFIGSQIGENLVGVLYALSSVLTIWIYTRATHSLARIGNRRFFFLYAFLQIASLAFLVIPTIKIVKIVAFIVYLTSANAIVFTLDVFFQRVAGTKNLGKNRGLFLLLGNAGYVIAPLVTAGLVDSFGYGGSYGFALMVMTLIIAIMFSKMQNYTDAKYTPHPSHVVIHKVLRNRSVKYVTIANLLLQFFYAWMIVYSPILLHSHLGLPWDTIGLIFSVMLTTFVILDYPLGKLADYIGSEKELTVIGFAIMALSVFGLAFLPLNNVFLIGTLFFFSRVGAATVEAMTEIHFFKVVKDTDSSTLSIFRDLRPFAYIIAPIIGASLLPIAPLKSLFAILGLIMILGVIASLKMEKSNIWWKRSHAK